jgi:hypothetical protein
LSEATASDHVRHEWLPQGWSIEPYPRQPDVVVIERPRASGGGMGSLDFKLRVWNSGHQLPRSFPDQVERSYGGRRWKEQMVRQACEWLEQAMA